MISRELIIAVLRRPGLWGEGLRSLAAMAPTGWWRRAPFAPVPEQEYADWRVATAHGDAGIPLTADELVGYLEWRKRQHRPLRRI